MKIRMKSVSRASLVSALAVLLSACGVASESRVVEEEEEGVAPDSYTYLLDGMASSAEVVTRLSEEGATLTYVMPSDEMDNTVHVFTTEAGFEGFKQNQDQGGSPGLLCVPVRMKTTVYDFISYGGDQEDFFPVTSLPFLAATPRPNGLNWDNDISSIKFADCVWTRLYKGTSYTLGSLARKGGRSSIMPAGFDNTISSLKVGP